MLFPITFPATFGGAGATLQGDIVNEGSGVEERGFVWDTSSQSKPGNISPSNCPYDQDWTETGSFSTGTYEQDITSFSLDTTYYVRAVIRTSDGWFYGDEVSFSTPQGVPTYTVDSILSLSRQVTLPFDSRLIKLKSITQNIDSFISKATTSTYLLDTAIEKKGGGELFVYPAIDLSAVISIEHSSDVIFDSVLSNTILDTYSIDSYLGTIALTKIYTIDSRLMISQENTYLLDSRLMLQNEKEVTFDSIIGAFGISTLEPTGVGIN